MLMTPITHADCFVALARSGDPAHAAALCGTSPAALLSAIQRLETELDGLLFTRLPGALRLSRLGAAWLPLMESLSGKLQTMPASNRCDHAPQMADAGTT